jgi:DNA-binding NarL/FixJ family response regulator
MSGPSILIVDDHAGFRRLARSFLRREGFDVVGEAANGTDAIDAVARIEPAVVLLDVQLPDMDAFEVCRRLATADHRTAVVLISTRDAQDYGSLVRQSGALGYITKSRLSASTLWAILRGLGEGDAG